MFIFVSLLFGIWSITQDWCVSWFMTTATLIPLHTQTFINELLLEEREPLVSVKHTWVLLMSSLSAHTVASLSALGHSPTPRFKLTHAPYTWWRSAIVKLFVVNMFLQLKPLSQPCPCLNCSAHVPWRKIKNHLLWLQGCYSSVLFTLNGSLSQFDFWWMEMSVLLQALIRAPRGP